MESSRFSSFLGAPTYLTQKSPKDAGLFYEGTPSLQLTRQNCGHQSSKHEEQHGEEEEAGVVEDLGGIVADV